MLNSYIKDWGLARDFLYRRTVRRKIIANLFYTLVTSLDVKEVLNFRTCGRIDPLVSSHQFKLVTTETCGGVEASS